jgi:hypothetical protein
MKKNNPYGSIVRILKTNQKPLVPVGMGMLLSDRHILTCFHVVENIVADGQNVVHLDFPLVESGKTVYESSIYCQFPTNDDPDGEQPEDICILQFKGKPTLPADASATNFQKENVEDTFEKKIFVFGYPPGDDAKGDWISGHLLGKTGKGWIQLDHELTSRTVDEGFSGSPAWNRDKSEVVGMIVCRDDREGKVSAYLIPVPVLQKAWPDMTPSKPEVKIVTRHVPQNLYRMCDRDRESIRFRRFFLNCCGQSPHVYFLPGRKSARQKSFIERMKDNCIDKYIQTRIHEEATALLKFIHWPFDGNLDERKELLLERIFLSLNETPPVQYPFTETTLQSSLPDYPVTKNKLKEEFKKLKKHGMALFVHEMPVIKWDDITRELMKWYMSDFWKSLVNNENLPDFMIFFNLLLPVKNENDFFERLLYQFKTKKRIYMELGEIVRELQQTGLCCEFEEFRDITKDHVTAWLTLLRNYGEFTDDQIKDLIKRIFPKGKTATMKQVEENLQQFITEMNKHISNI